jgi:hypothetical protein
MNNKFIFFILIIFFVIFNGKKESKKNTSPSFLFMLNGSTTNSISGGETFDLTLVPKDIMTFTDRPYHTAFSITQKELERVLDRMINKEKNPPNSSLIFYGEKNITWSGIVEIMDSKLDDQKITLKLKRLNDDSKKVQEDIPNIQKGTRVSLTIDDEQNYCSDDIGNPLCFLGWR